MHRFAAHPYRYLFACCAQRRSNASEYQTPNVTDVILYRTITRYCRMILLHYYCNTTICTRVAHLRFGDGGVTDDDGLRVGAASQSLQVNQPDPDTTTRVGLRHATYARKQILYARLDIQYVLARLELWGTAQQQRQRVPMQTGLQKPPQPPYTIIPMSRPLLLSSKVRRGTHFNTIPYKTFRKTMLGTHR